MARIGEVQVAANSGTTLQNDLFTGPEGGITHDYERQTIRIHDGKTAGGREIKEGAYRSVAIDFSDPDALVPVSLILLYLLPVGAVLMWSGSEASIPTGWKLCNGLNGTPDLRNRFVVGAGGTESGGEYLPGATGGSTAPTTDFQGLHDHTAVTNPGGGHLHLGNTDLGGEHIHTGTTSSNGSHDHVVTTNNATAPHSHTFNMDPASHIHGALSTSSPTSQNHTHTAQNNSPGESLQTIWIDTIVTGGLVAIAAVDSSSPPGGRPNAINIPTNNHTHSTGNPVAGSAILTHTHNFNPTPSPSGAHTHVSTVFASDTGGPADSTAHAHTGTAVVNGSHDHTVAVAVGGDHLHSFTSNYEADHVHLISTTSFSGNHQHTVSDNRPPYYALCFIMFTGT